jgi:hypothetical protein
MTLFLKKQPGPWVGRDLGKPVCFSYREVGTFNTASFALKDGYTRTKYTVLEYVRRGSSSYESDLILAHLFGGDERSIYILCRSCASAIRGDVCTECQYRNTGTKYHLLGTNNAWTVFAIAKRESRYHRYAPVERYWRFRMPQPLKDEISAKAYHPKRKWRIEFTEPWDEIDRHRALWPASAFWTPVTSIDNGLHKKPSRKRRRRQT